MSVEQQFHAWIHRVGYAKAVLMIGRCAGRMASEDKQAGHEASAKYLEKVWARLTECAADLQELWHEFEDMEGE